MRTGAKENDDIWISGLPGLSALGLQILRDHDDFSDSISKMAVNKHLHPEPRIELARTIARKKLANCAMDTSDGLVRDLSRICNTNNLGAILEEEMLPLPDVPDKYSDKRLEYALHGGEDYELLFTAAREKRDEIRKLSGVSLVGCMSSSTLGLTLKKKNGDTKNLSYQGFSHFEL